ncbi:MAG TPA: CrcB family protein, partial [Pilimelia sp.]|nr:CrcB family protein [Pilimelia sp.]
GGALGASARHGLALALPTAAGGFPLATFATNVAGCAALGALAGLVRGRPVLAPFVGAGLLGGFTTFSTYAVETIGLARAGRPWLATGYALATAVCGLAAAWVGGAAVRRR